MKKSKPLPPTEKRGLITVVPFGRVGDDVLRVVVDSLQGVLRLPVDTYTYTPISEEAFVSARDQYNALVILKDLSLNYCPDSLKVLGITNRDLCNPILQYVFGEAYMGGRAALISCHRLYAGQHGGPVSREQFLDRVVKVAVHEIGHTFSIPHCHTGRCVMRASNNLAELDEKLNYLCPYCEVFLADGLRDALIKHRDEAKT